MDSFELGWKADLLDNTLRLNTALFYAMYHDIQQIVTNNTGGFPIDNIGEVDVYGLEMETVWSPIDRLNVFANLGVQESDFGTVDPQSPPGGLEPPPGLDPDLLCPNRPDPTTRQCAVPTDELPSNPGWQGKIGFDHTVLFQDNLKFVYGTDLFHSDEYFSESRNQVEIDSYTRVNGFLGIGEVNDRWQVMLTGKNITDEEDVVSGIFAQGFTNVRTLLPPAEYMLTFRMSY